MAADDVFGDSSLFEEFEKERESSSSFIFYEKDDQGSEDRSKIVFQFSDSSSSDSDDEAKTKVQEQSVALAVKLLQTQNGIPEVNGDLETEDESGDENDSSQPFIGKDRPEKSTIFKLTHERDKYKRFCNIIDSTRYKHDDESSAVQIIFQNNSFSRKYRVEIEDFIKHLIEKDRHTDSEILQKLDLKASVPSCTDLNDKIPGERRTEKLRQAHVILGCSQFYQDYVIDSLGWPMVEYNPSLTDGWEIPIYELVFTDIIPVDEELVKANAKKMEKERSKPKCWNCGGDHMLPDCKEPRNQQRINESRKELAQQKLQKQQSGPPKSGRYHKDTATEEKFEKYKPGHLSDELRQALGLEDSQIPIYIYKMRALGYPPGWMEEAKSAPGLAMFDENGDDTEENEGEDKLDPEKIIEYPGFTVELPENVIDEAEHYGLPPLQPHQLKSTLLASIQEQEQCKKRAQDEAEEQEKKRLKIDSVDMDLDDDQSNSNLNPPLPPETPPSRPPPPENTPPPTPKDSPAHPPRMSLSRETSQGRSDSPTLAELEMQYQLLQKTIEDEGEIEDGELIVIDSADEKSQESIQSADQSLIEVDSEGAEKTPIILTDDSIDNTDSADENASKAKLLRNISTTSIQTFGELGTGSPASSVPGTPSHNPFIDNKPSFKGTISMSRDFGTPVLNRSGSFTSLPQDTQFSQGIEEHIPFENLPDATGTFDRMRKLISKIRDKLPTRKKKS